MIGTQKAPERTYFTINGRPATPSQNRCGLGCANCTQQCANRGMGATDPNSGEYTAEPTATVTEWITANWQSLIITAVAVWAGWHVVQGWKQFGRKRRQVRKTRAQKRLKKAQEDFRRAA